MSIDTPARFDIFATLRDGHEQMIGQCDDKTQANKLLLEALRNGAIYGHIVDHDPDRDVASRDHVVTGPKTMES